MSNHSTPDNNTNNHISIHQSGASMGTQHGVIDFFLALLGVGLVLILALMLLVFGVIALPVVALVTLIYGLAKL